MGHQRALWPLYICLILLLTTVACSDDEETVDDDPDAPTDQVIERDRSIDIPDVAGVMGADFDPDDQPRVVDPEHWSARMRTAGPPEAMPQELVIAIDRSVIRRNSPVMGEGTRMVVRGDDGHSVAIDDWSITDDYRTLRATLGDGLQPDTTYTARLEAVEFDFQGDDDSDFFEFDEPIESQFETPETRLIDVSPVRPVGAHGHVTLRFSTPVDGDLLDDLQWDLDGSDVADVTYERESERHYTARIQSAASPFRIANNYAALSNTPTGENFELPVGASSNGIVIWETGLFERAGTPTLRVICHDESSDDTLGFAWDSEIRANIRNISSRCDLDVERLLDHIRIDVDGTVSVAEHRHGVDLLFDLDDPQGPLGVALRSGQWAEGDMPLVYDGHEELLSPDHAGPSIGLEADGRYLRGDDWSRVPIRHQGVEWVRVVVRHAQDAHFGFWLSGGDELQPNASFALAESYLQFDPSAEDEVSYIDMQDLVGDPAPGAYQIEVSAPFHGGLRDSHRLLVSDVQLIAKRASHDDEEVDEVWAWTVDATSAEPVEETPLELVRSNGRVLAECTTDDQGFCKLSGNWGDLENEPPIAVVAEGSNDLAYIDWEDTRTEIVEGSVDGAPYANRPPYRGAINPERTLYRPGETLSLAAAIRGDSLRAEADLPVGIELTDARFQRAFSGVVDTDATGALEWQYDIPDMAPTGRWDIELFSGDETIASQSITVEEFVPERIDINLDVDDRQVGDRLRGTLQADYFFGLPASDTEFEIECHFQPTHPFPDEWPDYAFGPFQDDLDTHTDRHRGTLDDQGRASIDCSPPSEDVASSYEIDVTAAVFEGGSGRPARQTESAHLITDAPLIGLRSPDDRAHIDDGARLQGVVVDAQGQTIDGDESVDIEAGAIRYSTTRTHVGGRTQWERERHISVDERRQVQADDGRFSLRLAARGQNQGIYARASLNERFTETEIDAPRRHWGWHWQDQDLDPRPDDPAHLSIDGPDEITVDEPATFSFDAPSSGRALVATETDRVDDWQWLNVGPGTNEWEVELQAFEPNVYVSALFVPTGEEAPQEMDRAFGVTRVAVNRDHWRADFDLHVPDERQPGETLDITVDAPDAGPNAQVAIAAVDRGILSMATESVDDPINQLFLTRALGITTFDTVGWYADVSPERFGGGAMSPPPPSPEAIMPVRPTSLWSGLVDLDDGRATVEFPIPDFSGELEITAFLIDDDHLGHASDRTTVRDPLTLQATTPRFATHGDMMEIPLSITNTTDDSIDAELSVQALPDLVLDGDDRAAITLTGDTSFELALDPGERSQVHVELEVEGHAGVPELLFEAHGGGHSSRHQASLPIYPEGLAEVEMDNHTIRGDHFDVSTTLQAWLPTSETTELWLTSVPHAPAFRHLEQLMHYPLMPLGTNLYNTVARVRPLLYLDDLLEAADPTSDRPAAPWRIRSGLHSVQRLQDSAGRFRFWPNSWVTVSPHGQAYVLDMLTTADEAGYDLPPGVMQNGLDWLDRRVQRRHNLQNLDLALWVLSRQGRPNRDVARALLESLPSDLSGRDHERALLATASLYRGGDETVEDDLRQLLGSVDTGSDGVEDPDRYIALRHQGLALEVGHELFGDDPVLDPLVDAIAQTLAGADGGDLAIDQVGWAISGLGKWANERREAIPDARLIAGDSEVSPNLIADDGSRSWTVHRASEYASLDLVFDEEPSTDLTLFRRTQGVRPDASMELDDQGLRMERTLRTPDGDQLNPRNIEIGDLVFVELTVENPGDVAMNDLALIDRLPGGLEIENPRPEGDLQPDWFDGGDRWSVEHFDVRDDRLQLYGDLAPDQERRFIYSMRATTAGSFSTPPSEFISTYRPDYFSRIRGLPVQIYRP